MMAGGGSQAGLAAPTARRQQTLGLALRQSSQAHGCLFGWSWPGAPADACQLLERQNPSLNHRP